MSDLWSAELFDNNDVHIHVPEGAISKEGPSAGITLTTALLSAFKDKKVLSEIAMTGEITLTGDVLAIGGVKEKVIGAYRAKVKKIFIPKANESDLEEIPDEIKKELKFVFVDDYLEVFKKIFK